MNPLKCKKQWEKQWTRGKDPSQRRHPRSLSGSDMGTSSSSSMSSSPSPQYSPEIPQMDNLTEFNSPSDGAQNFGNLPIRCILPIPINYSIEARIQKFMEHPFRLKAPRVNRAKECEESPSDEDIQHRFKAINWWKKEKHPNSQYITTATDAQETTNTDEIRKESSCSPETGTETKTNDISSSPKERKVTSLARNTFSSDSPTPSSPLNWPPKLEGSDVSATDQFWSRVNADRNNYTFNELRGRNEVDTSMEEDNSTEMSTTMHKTVENYETFHAEIRTYRNTTPRGSNKDSNSWTDSENTHISEGTGKTLKEEYVHSNTSPPPLSLINSERPKMPPLEPVTYSEVPTLVRNDPQVNHLGKQSDRTCRTPHEYQPKPPHEYTENTEGICKGRHSGQRRVNELYGFSKRENIRSDTFVSTDPRTKLFIEALRSKSITGQLENDARYAASYNQAETRRDANNIYYSPTTDHKPTLKRNLPLYYRPDIAYKPYSDPSRIHTPPYISNEASNLSHSKRTKHHSYPDDDKYKNTLDNQFSSLRGDFSGLRGDLSMQEGFYPRQTSINPSVPLIERIIASQNSHLRPGYPKLLQSYRNDSAGSEARKECTQNETDIDVQGGGLLRSKKGRLDTGNYSFSAPDYRGNNEEEKRHPMSQEKKNPFHQLTSPIQTHSIAAHEKKANENKNKSSEGSNKQDLNLREDIEQLYMNKFQTTPKNQPITLDFNGIDVTITGFQLIYSNSEDFKNIICNYPQHVQGHLKEMRRKMKNRDAAKRSRSKRDGRLYQLRHDKSRNAEKLARIEKMVEKINKLKEIKRVLLDKQKKNEKSRFSVNSFNEFVSQNEENKNLWDRNEVHSPEGFFKTTTSINTAGKSRCSNAVKVAENIIAAEQKHLTNNTESAKSFNVNSFKEMNH